MSTVPRKHHTIPRFYLAHFAHKARRGERLWVLDKAKGEWRLQNPSGVAKETDFYAIDAPPLRPDVVETDVLARYESLIAPRIKTIRSRALAAYAKVGRHPFPASSSFVDDLASFVALMHVRSAPSRASVRVLSDQMGRRMLARAAPNEQEFAKRKAAAASDGVDLGSLSYSDIRAAITTDAFRFDLTNTTHVIGMLGAWKELRDALMKKRCSLMIAPRRETLISSDSPAGFYKIGRTGEIDLSKVDPREEGTGVAMALFPDLAVVFDNQLGSVVAEMTRADLAVMNSNVAIAGARFVFARQQVFSWFEPEAERISQSYEEFLRAAATVKQHLDVIEVRFAEEKADAAMKRLDSPEETAPAEPGS